MLTRPPPPPHMNIVVTSLCSLSLRQHMLQNKGNNREQETKGKMRFGFRGGQKVCSGRKSIFFVQNEKGISVPSMPDFGFGFKR